MPDLKKKKKKKNDPVILKTEYLNCVIMLHYLVCGHFKFSLIILRVDLKQDNNEIDHCEMTATDGP